MAAQELRWLTYLLTDLGEPPRSPPVMYIDNKAMLALCREHRLEHRTKHIALRYFLARELQQCGQLRLAYVASQANTADIFTKALQPCDHHRFCTMLACFALLCLTGLKRPSDWTPSMARNQEGNAHTASGEADDSRESLVLLADNRNKAPSDLWFIDTGVTQHMTHSASLLNNIGAPGDVMSIVFGNDKSLAVVGVGSTRLIADSVLVDITNGEQFAQGVLNGELYQLKTHPKAASSNMAQGSKATLKAWHNRLAHTNYESVKELANKGLAKGVDVIAGDDEKSVCAACVEGKMARKPFGSSVERLNRTLVEAVRSLLQHSKLGNEWWGEASALAAWIRNHVPTNVLPGTTPFEAWTGTKPNLSLLRTFGCLWYYQVSDPFRHKLQPKSRTTIYLGIAANERAWREWELGDKRVVTPRDVVFDEDKFPTKEKPTQQVTFILPAREEVKESEVPPQVEKEAEDGGGEINTESIDDVVEVSRAEAATTSTPSSLPLALTREHHEVRPHPKYSDYATVAVGELDKECAAFCFTTKGDDEYEDSLMEPPPKDPSCACYGHVGLNT
ncbi:unnamed protein product [Closterium sp. NIES-53]